MSTPVRLILAAACAGLSRALMRSAGWLITSAERLAGGATPATGQSNDGASAQPAAGPGQPLLWFALPGGLLELQDTGFQIQMVPQRNSCHYRLMDPDGGCVAYSLNLQGLKQLAEQCARDRAEFGCQVTGSWRDAL